jgi:hypothetical protein
MPDFKPNSYGRTEEDARAHRSFLFSMHHEIDDYKIAGAFISGLVVASMFFSFAAIIWQVSQNVQVG